MQLSLPKQHPLAAASAAVLALVACAQSADPMATTVAHPEDTSGSEWTPLFQEGLEDAIVPDGIWTVQDGVLTASEDKAIWSQESFDNFVLDLEFKTDKGTNSGVFVYVSDTDRWVVSSVEIQIADDHADRWANANPSMTCGAFFGHKPAFRQKVVNEPGEWNRMTVTCIDSRIWVVLNGEPVNEIDLSEYTSAEVTPDGQEIPRWLKTPWAELPTEGRVGLQGKHAGADIYFRNVAIKPIDVEI